MDTKQKNDNLKFILQRYDSYYSAMGLRGNAYLTINIAILAGLMTGYFTSDKAYVGKEMSLLVVFALLCNFASITNTLRALRPFIADKVSSLEYTSVFSGVIGGHHSEHHEDLWQDMDEEKWHKDLTTQATIYSAGIEYKFKALTQATWLIWIQVLCVIIFALALLMQRAGIFE